MKHRTIWIGLTIVVCLVTVTSMARAETCYKLVPYVDVIRLTAFQSQSSVTGDNHILMYGNWLSGSNDLPVVGSRELIHGSTTVRRLALFGLIPESVNGNPLCTLMGTTGSAWTLVCTGGAGARFTNHGTSLSVVTCSGVAPSDAGGPSALEP